MINIEITDEIKKLVHETIIKYGGNELDYIISAMNIEIYDLPIAFIQEESLSVKYDNRTIIFIDFELDADRYCYRLVHELGHILMHDDACNHLYRHKRKGFDHRILDYEADYFAEELLSYREVDI